MTIRSDDELQGLEAVGRIVARVLDAMEDRARAGVTTAELDEVAARSLAAQGARSAPRLVYDFPGYTCISVDDEVVHGVPGERLLRRGDLVKLDVTVEKDGFMADAARTVLVEGRGGTGAHLAAAAKSAFHRALGAVRAGERVRRVGERVEREVGRRGFAVIRELAGHGIGRTIHEPPTVPNFSDPGARSRLEEGMVITIEPLVCAGSGRVFLDSDGWTVRTADRTLAAHYEHTLVVTRGRPVLLTAA